MFTQRLHLNTFMREFFVAITVAIFLLLPLLVPLSLHAAGTIIPCGNSNTSGQNGGATQPCTFSDLMTFFSRFINFALAIMVALATVAIAYAGFLYLVSGVSSEQRSKANNIFWSIGKGFFWVATAYLIVKFIIMGLVSPSISGQLFR